MATVEKRGTNTYRLTASDGFDSSGKRRYKKKTIKLDEGLTEKQKEKELQRQIVLFEKEVDNGNYLDGSKITFGEFINQWLTTYAEKELAASTMHAYRSRLEKRIIPALGHIKLNKLQPNHLLEFYSNLTEEGIRLDRIFRIKTSNLFDGIDLKKLCEETGVRERALNEIKNGKQTDENTATKISEYFKEPILKLFDFVNKQETLSSRTVLHHHRLISSILTSAVQWQLIESNPAQRIKPPKVEKTQVRFYDEDDVIDMFEKLETEPIRYNLDSRKV